MSLQNPASEFPDEPPEPIDKDIHRALSEFLTHIARVSVCSACVISLAAWCLSTLDAWMCVLSHFSLHQLFVTPWTGAHHAPLSIGLSRQEYERGLPRFSPGDFPNPGIESVSPAAPSLVGGFFTTWIPGKPPHWIVIRISLRDLNSFRAFVWLLVNCSHALCFSIFFLIVILAWW